MMRLAVDAMGGDHAPREIVKGAVEAAGKLDNVSKILLVGDSASVQKELDSLSGPKSKIEIVHASEVVLMDEAPAQAIRRKKDSSIGRAVDMVKNDQADAVVSAGNTGAIVVAATLKLRTLEGVQRPAILTVMPTPDRPFVLLDVGANTDCSPSMLVDFAVMGSCYARIILHRENPVVGLMSIGGEDFKGNEITKETFGLLNNSSLNFRGNVEGHDLFKGETDVVVCDGFVGNTVLKTSESVVLAVRRWAKQEFTRNPLRMLGVLLLTGALKAMKHRLDPEMYGGAPLLGVNGTCIKAHGSSSSRAIFHAIRVASESVHHHLNEAIVENVERVGRGA